MLRAARVGPVIAVLVALVGCGAVANDEAAERRSELPPTTDVPPPETLPPDVLAPSTTLAGSAPIPGLPNPSSRVEAPDAGGERLCAIVLDIGNRITAIANRQVGDLAAYHASIDHLGGSIDELNGLAPPEHTVGGRVPILEALRSILVPLRASADQVALDAAAVTVGDALAQFQATFQQDGFIAWVTDYCGVVTDP